MNTYRVLLPLLVHTEDGAYGQGEVFEKTFDSVEDEAANLDSGLLEIVPREYKNIGGSIVHGAAPGEVFEAALRMHEEELLTQGGHIERVERPVTPKKKRGAN